VKLDPAKSARALRRAVGAVALGVVLATVAAPGRASAGYDAKLLTAQQKLAKLGYYYAEPDGYASPDTSAALERFQEDNGLEKTGRLDAATLDTLGIHVSKFEDLQKEAVLITPITLLTEKIYTPLAGIEGLPQARVAAMDEFQLREFSEYLRRQRELVNDSIYQINVPYDSRSKVPNLFHVSEFDFQEKHYEVKVNRGYNYQEDYGIDFGHDKTYFVHFEDVSQARNFKRVNDASALQAELIFRPLRTERIRKTHFEGGFQIRWGYLLKCDLLALRISNRETGEVIIQDDNPLRYDAITRRATDVFKDADDIVW